jgi:hypothetical protein
VNHQAAAVADVGQVTEDLERLDKSLALGTAAASMDCDCAVHGKPSPNNGAVQ